jgi:hypothetical protein
VVLDRIGSLLCESKDLLQIQARDLARAGERRPEPESRRSPPWLPG